MTAAAAVTQSEPNAFAVSQQSGSGSEPRRFAQEIVSFRKAGGAIGGATVALERETLFARAIVSTRLSPASTPSTIAVATA